MVQRESTSAEDSSIDGRDLLSGGFFLTVGAIVQALVGLGAQLLLMRLLLPDEFGEFAIVLAGASLAQVLLSLRLGVLIVRATDAELTAARRERYRAALVWETVAAAVVTLIWLMASGLMTGYAAVLVAALAIGQWTNQAAAFYERSLAYGRIAVVESGSQVIGHISAIVLILSGAGAASLYLREIIAALVRLVAYVRIGALEQPRIRLPRWDELRALVAEARAFWVDGVMEGGFARIIVLAAASLGGTRGAGIFSQSLRLAVVPHQFVSPVVFRMSANVFSRIDDNARRRRWLISMTLGTLAVLVFAAGLAIVFADPFVPLVLGEHWRPATRTIVAMAGVIIFMSGFDLLRAYCFSQRRMKVLFAGRVVQYTVFIAGCVAALGADDPILLLAISLSLAYAGAFAALAAGLAFIRPTIVPNGTS